MISRHPRRVGSAYFRHGPTPGKPRSDWGTWKADTPLASRPQSLLFQVRFLRFAVFQPTGRLEITIWVARVVRVVGKCVAVLEKIFYVLHRDGKAEAFAKDFHVRHAGDFASQVKKR